MYWQIYLRSRPSRARGLKLHRQDSIVSICSVAPFTGAWIETRLGDEHKGVEVWSRPSRARGLKPVFLPIMLCDSQVAPFTGAWIETYKGRNRTPFSLVAPFTGAWIETAASKLMLVFGSCRALHGRVD